MLVRKGDGKIEYGPGVTIELTRNELATAIDSYLVAHSIYVCGSRTITINGEICKDVSCEIYVDPSGFVIADGERHDGRE